MVRLRATVVRGQGLGRRLGFPTANLRVGPGALPPLGVYQVRVRTAGLPWRLAVCNVGVRPTLGGSGRPTVEVHIPGFSGDLYGRTLEVSFLEKIREEMRFASLEALKRRIRRDIQTLGVAAGTSGPGQRRRREVE